MAAEQAPNALPAPINFFSLALELRQEIYEHLYEQGSVLHLPRIEESTIQAARLSNERVDAEITAWEATRREQDSKRYRTVHFTVSPGEMLPLPAIDWTKISNIEIEIDHLALSTIDKADEEGYYEDLLEQQIGEMQTNLQIFVKTLKENCPTLPPVNIAFRSECEGEEGFNILETLFDDEQELHLPIVWHFLKPLLELPVCESAYFEVYKGEAVDTSLDGLEGEYDDEYIVLIMFAMEGWLKGDRSGPFAGRWGEIAEAEFLARKSEVESAGQQS